MIKELKEKFGHFLDAGLLKQIEIVGVMSSFEQNDIIIDIGQPLNQIPLLLYGNIKILREDEEGNELLLYFLEQGDTCAMSLSCCLAGAKSKIRAVADKDSTLMMIPSNYMEKWFDTNKSWRNFILNSYQVRFDEMLETIDTLAFLKMDARLHKYLTDKVKLNGDTQLTITHQEIAEDLNTSRVVVSRLLKKLENEKLIKLFRNKIEVIRF